LAGALRKHLAVKGWNLSTLDPVIVVAKGNPKKIHGLKDLAAPGIKIIFTHETYHYMGIVPRMADKAGIRAQLEKNCVSYAGGGSEASNELSLGTADAAVVWNVIASLRENNLDVVPIEPEYRLQSGVDAVSSATFGIHVRHFRPICGAGDDFYAQMFETA
jgi:molybdate transport system substrate-binding protein